MALSFSPPIPHQTHQLSRSIIAAASLVALLYFGRDFFVTLLISAIFAFILDPAVLFVMKLKVPRALATAIVIGFAIVAMWFLGVTAWNQISVLAEELPGYSTRAVEVVNAASARFEALESHVLDLVVPRNLRQQEQQIEQKPKQALQARRRKGSLAQPAPVSPPPVQEVRIHTDPRPLIGTVYSYVSGYLQTLVMASFVPFLVYFMLSWRDHIERGFLQLFPSAERYVIGQSWSHIGRSTRAFVLGNFLLWIFLACLSALAFFFLGLPYWPIVGLTSALLSLVPYVGLPMSLLPPLLAALAVPNKFKIVVAALAVTAILHVVTMNFVYAKIVGRRVRLNPLAVTVAMMFWGLLWGGVGLLLAVPITAGIKAVCDNVESLEPFGRLLGD